MKIKKLNESSLVDKKVSTLGKDGKPMYFTDDQLQDAKAKYPEYDFEETTIDKSLPAEQKAYIAKLKEDINDPDEVLDFKRDVEAASDLVDIEHLIWGLSDGVAEDAVQRAFYEVQDAEDLQSVKDAVIREIDIYLEENEWLGESMSKSASSKTPVAKAYIAKKKVTEDIDDSSELEANKMTIMPLAGLNADGFTVIINDAAGEELFKKEYRYGHNASYDRRFAQWAEKDHEDSIKYGWKNPRALKPYVADIVDELCIKYGIDKNSIEFVPGKNTFTGDSVTSDFVDTMKKRVYESKSKKLKEGITNTEPIVKFQGKSSHTLTKDKKWEVDFDEAGNILARTRHGEPSYFKGHINDETNDFPSTDEDNIILAAREQHGLKFGNKEIEEGYSHAEVTSGDNLEDITQYRDELQKYIDNEMKRSHVFFVDETFDGRLCVEINWGDWKHEHLACDWLVREFFANKNKLVNVEVDTTEENGTDAYSAIHYYSLRPESSIKDEPIELELMSEGSGDTEYSMLKNLYKNCRKFNDVDAQSGEIRDLIDDLEAKGIDYEEYTHKTDNGITIFHEKVAVDDDNDWC